MSEVRLNACCVASAPLPGPSGERVTLTHITSPPPHIQASLRAAIPHHVQDSPCKPIYEQLVGIKGALTRIKDAKPTHTVEELAAYREKLKEIDDARGAGGIFAGGLSHEGAAKIPGASAVMQPVSRRC